MNIRERLELRAFINVLLNIIERLVKIFSKNQCNSDSDGCPIEPHKKPKSHKRVIDLLPWRNKK